MQQARVNRGGETAVQPELRVPDAAGGQTRSVRMGRSPSDHINMSEALQSLQTALRDFARDRDWEQFHTPKNLATALAVEAAELLEHFQWLTDKQSRTLDDAKRNAVGEEIADVLLYLLQLADKLDIDPIQAAKRKLRLNGEKYPVDRARGRSDKYTEL